MLFLGRKLTSFEGRGGLRVKGVRIWTGMHFLGPLRGLVLGPKPGGGGGCWPEDLAHRRQGARCLSVRTILLPLEKAPTTRIDAPRPPPTTQSSSSGGRLGEAVLRGGEAIMVAGDPISTPFRNHFDPVSAPFRPHMHIYRNLSIAPGIRDDHSELAKLSQKKSALAPTKILREKSSTTKRSHPSAARRPERRGEGPRIPGVEMRHSYPKPTLDPSSARLSSQNSTAFLESNGFHVQSRRDRAPCGCRSR